MNAVDRLRRDHAILRSKLDILESALKLGPQAWYVLREVCFTLARQLRDHMKREEHLVVACRKGMNPEVLAEISVEHRDEPKHLRTINRLFVAQSDQSLDRIKPALLEVITGLRHHMTEEEAELFPLFERVLGEQETPQPVTPMGETRVNETMTVNRVAQEFPRTRPVFERLFINVPMEGCSCLDEVAWRHGMDCRQLLLLLEEAIAAGCRCEEAVAA